MKAVISGYYGFDNTGDEAVLEAIITQLRKTCPDIGITVLSADPKKTTSDFKVSSIGRYSVIKIIQEIKDSDVLISGGGGLLQDVTGRFSVLYYLGVIWLARFFGKKFVIFAQGYGPVKNPVNKYLVRSTLNKATLITLRDENSLSEIRKNGVTRPPQFVTADPVFLLEKKKLPEEYGSAIGVCLRRPVKTVPGFKENIAKALDEISKRHNMRPVFIPFHFPEDVEYCAEIALLMNSRPDIITKQHVPGEVLGLIESFSFIVGMRFHSIILAATAGVPVMAIDYDPKVASLIKELELPSVKCDFSVEDFIKVFENARNNRQRLSETVKKKIDLLKERALLNFKVLFEYIDDLREFHLLGIKINNVTVNSALLKIEDFIKSRKPHLIFTPNPEIITAAQKDKELAGIINSADLNIPDGIGIVAAAKLLGIHLKERVTGIDLMTKMLDLSKKNGYKVFLLGSKPGIAEEAANRLKDVNIVGTHHGYFKDEFDRNVIAKIRDSKPDILFCGLGSPRQEKWLFKYYKEIGAPVNMVIGGSLDVLSGRAKRAPDIAQKLGIEWLYRLIKEPSRIKRQLNLVRFGWLVVKNNVLRIR